MPPLPPAAGVIRVSLQHTYEADTNVFSRFFVSYTGTAPTAAQMNTFAAAVTTAYSSNLASLLNDNLFMTGVVCEDLSSSTGAVGSSSTSVTGTRAGSVITNATCALLNFKIARRYRGGKPRLYLPFGSIADTATSNTWTAGFISAVNTGWTNFITAVIAAAWTGATITGQSNVSFYQGFTNFTGPTGRERARSTPRTGSAVVDAMSSHALNPKFGTQRRRILH